MEGGGGDNPTRLGCFHQFVSEILAAARGMVAPRFPKRNLENFSQRFMLTFGVIPATGAQSLSWGQHNMGGKSEAAIFP